MKRLSVKLGLGLCLLLLATIGLDPLGNTVSSAQTTLTPDQYEPNNAPSQATNLGRPILNAPIVIHANFHGAEDQHDWYYTIVSGGIAGSVISPHLRMTVGLTGTPSDYPYEVTLFSGSYTQEVAKASGTSTAELAYAWDSACGFLGTAVCDRTIRIHVQRPAEAAGALSYDLTVTVEQPSQQPTAPQVLNLTPTNGPVGTTVTIAGAHFSGTTAVKFQGVPSTFTITADNSISTTVPPGATTGLITVSTPGGNASSSSNFTVTSETTPPSKKGGISPVSPDKKQPPSVKPGTTQAPSAKIPDTKTPKKSKGPKPNCIGMGCGDNAPTCVGMGCGQKEPQCIGMGCEKKGAADPNQSGPAGSAKLPSVKTPTVHGLEPCCNVVSIAATGLVTAKDNTTGQTFQFQATNQAFAKSLRVGQKVYADFGTQQVSVDGAAPCCAIMSVGSGAAGAGMKP